MSGNILNAIQLRVLGSLLEKEATTPEYYPLTLNALVAACNQKSNRWPVTDLSETDISGALRELRAIGFAAELSGAGMRVSKHAQRITETLNLGRRESAILCVLMLRGPQTLGEIRDRAERIHSFDDMDEVQLVLGKLAERGLALQLSRMPGQKESRYAHQLGDVTQQESASINPSGSDEGRSFSQRENTERIDALEQQVSNLRDELNQLRQKLESVL